METKSKHSELNVSNVISVPSVNFHLWEPCNMRCKFCFATFQDVKKTILPKGHLPKDQSLEIVKQFASFGFEKITFVGGEPTLCPWLPELIILAKKIGMNTGIVTNSTGLNESFLSSMENHLDWIGLSIDSLDTKTNISSGRAIAGRRALGKDDYEKLLTMIQKYDYKLKINTVVNSYNVNENMTEFIHKFKIQRWKVFQVLPIQGENDHSIDEMKVSSIQFQEYLKRHEMVSDVLVPENNKQMKGSYAMVDPAGRFFENKTGKLQYSEPILKVGVGKAYSQANPDIKKFLDRGGLYDWNK
ncbi:viperin family antiviral radical SAM protein [Crocinitomicaceae bacterium]|nr:viperin family antiviral radical SAM protein [Crocinitomicaceae bacterium]